MQAERSHRIGTNPCEKRMEIHDTVIFSSTCSVIFPELYTVPVPSHRDRCRRNNVFASLIPVQGQTWCRDGRYTLCFALESIGFWSIYSPLNFDSLLVAAYIFVLVFSLTFMKDFKDVAGDVNSLPLLLGIRRAAKVCCLLTILPLIPLINILAKYQFLVPAAAIYVILTAGCIKILLGDPVAEGHRLKGKMILALIIPNFSMLFFKYGWLF